MIRRELKLNEQLSLWLLVSQVAHARLSGELVKHWRPEFSVEVVEAITHHDNGWEAWENEAKINPSIGAPYSFLEMPLEESLPIWDRSIATSRKYGPLGGCIVAGHFYNLLANSDHAKEPMAIAWLTAKRKVRTAWLDEWIRASPSHKLENAKAAQLALQTADLFSLWLCCDCPVDSFGANIQVDPVMKLRSEALLAQFEFMSPDCTVFESGSRQRVEELLWTVPVKPFPFSVGSLSLAIKAQAVPLKPYTTLDDVAAAAWPFELKWQLVPAV